MNWPPIMYHVDINACYASISAMEFPSLRGRPIAVCGSEAERHGIVLCASYEAKKYGIRTAEVNWSARQKCKELTIVDIDQLGRDVIGRVADCFLDTCYSFSPHVRQEGDDGAYMDMQGVVRDFPEARRKALELQQLLMDRIGVPVSIGVGPTWALAKIGSDYRKPFAVTTLAPENWRDIVWPLPVTDLYWVASRNAEKLYRLGARTIGQLAALDVEQIFDHMGVIGRYLWLCANGKEAPFLAFQAEGPPTKSVGNSTTAMRDLVSEADIRHILVMLAESVSERMREAGLLSTGIAVGLRSCNLGWIERQVRLPFPTRTSRLLGSTALELALKNWDGVPLRGMALRAIRLMEDDAQQMALLPDMVRDQKDEVLDTVVQDIRRRMGHGVIVRGGQLEDRELVSLDIRNPVSAQSNAFRFGVYEGRHSAC